MISFPDFPECFSDGNNMQQAYENAVDALELAITSRQQEKTTLPDPTDVSEINVNDGFLVVIEFALSA